MKTSITFALLFIVGFASAQIPGGWNKGTAELTKQNKELISFGLQEISRANNGFQALEYQPVKILEFSSQVVAGINTKMLVEIDNGKKTPESKKLLQVSIFSGLRGERELKSWTVLDSTATFQAMNDESTLKDLKTQIERNLAYEDAIARRPRGEYIVSKIHAAFQTQQYGKKLHYVKATVQGVNNNSIKLHEYWFNENGVFAHTPLPMNRGTLESHPQLTLARGANGLQCENLASYFFCGIASGCVNNVLENGKCEGMTKQ